MRFRFLSLSFVPRVLFAIGATLLASCTDGSDSDDRFNVRVFGVDIEGNSVGLAHLFWTYGTFGEPEGLTSVPCSLDDLNEECSSLDIGFEAQGEIGILAITPLPGAGPGCIYGLNGDARIVANPSEQQVVTVVTAKIGLQCPPD